MEREKDTYIFGIHAVMEAIRACKPIDKVLLRRDFTGEQARELLATLRQYDILTQRVPMEKLNRVTRKNHQGVIAVMSAVGYVSLGQLVPMLYEDGRLPLIVLLDGITDIRNFGAIARTALCAGVDAIVIPERGSVSVNADAVKTSAGALMHIPVCREKSIKSAVELLKQSGYQIIGASEKSNESYTKVDFTLPTAIVMGAEDTGISPDVIAECDHLSAIPIMGEVGSLNVSVAAGVMLYEAVRQRLSECRFG